MTESNKRVFQRLLNSIPASYPNYHLINNSINRNIKRLDTTDDHWLKTAKIINRVQCHLEKEVIAIEFDDSKYLIFYDENEDISSPFIHGVLSKEPLNAGLLTLLYSDEGNINLSFFTGFEDELVNTIFGITDGLIDITIVSKFFSNLELWKVNDEFDLSNDNELYKIFSARIILEANKLNLRFSATCLSNIKSLLENQNATILSDKIFNALTSIHWVQAYLEFYRCIEFLYRIPYITEFHGHLQSYDSDGTILVKLAKGLERLNWKKNEDQAIVKLYTYFDNNTSKKNIHKILFDPEPMDPDNIVSSKRIAKELYSIRNNLVHWRKGSDKHLEMKYNWDSLISEISIFLDFKYDFYSFEINSLDD